jgi:hypothetical protein
VVVLIDTCLCVSPLPPSLRSATIAIILSSVSGSADVIRDAVRRLVAAQRPDWVGLLQAACVWAAKAETNGSGLFAGAWVLEEWAARTGNARWRPGGLRPLAAEGLIEKVGDSTRGGRRAYYRMPQRQIIEAALRELGVPELPPARR